MGTYVNSNPRKNSVHKYLTDNVSKQKRLVTNISNRATCVDDLNASFVKLSERNSCSDSFHEHLIEHV